jgi:hypothetical protein
MEPRHTHFHQGAPPVRRREQFNPRQACEKWRAQICSVKAVMVANTVINIAQCEGALLNGNGILPAIIAFALRSQCEFRINI